MFAFEWDPAKAASNERKHGVSFGEAATVFADELLMSVRDDDHATIEERWISQGQSNNGRLLIVAHTYRELDESATRVRIISARLATPRERRSYEMKP